MLKKKVIKFLLFAFLILHLIPFAYKENYQFLTILNYSIILFFLFVFSFNRKKIDFISIIFMCLIFISTIMSLFGYSGTVSSLILVASLPHFLFININSKDEFLQLFFQPIMLCSFLLILFSAQLYNDVEGELTDYYYLGSYFITASINYVPLVLNTFCVLLYLLLRTNMDEFDEKKIYSLFLVLIIFITIYFSFIFLTRTVFACSVLLLLAYFKKLIKYSIFIIPIIVYYYFNDILLGIIEFFGSDNVVNIASDNIRYNSVKNLINAQVNFIFDFRNNMSYSSLINLLFSIFPLTLVFLYNPIRTLIIIINNRDISLFFAFLSCLITVIYQMDFLSMFGFFFLITYVNKFLKNNTYVSRAT